jgi:hypothetical protein
MDVSAMSAEYTLAVVYRDGNPIDVESFGADKDSALGRLRQRRFNENRHHEHWMVFDADDPERGYFDPA